MNWYSSDINNPTYTQISKTVHKAVSWVVLRFILEALSKDAKYNTQKCLLSAKECCLIKKCKNIYIIVSGIFP